MNRLLCAGKKIHEILLDVDNMGVRDIAVKYMQECQLRPVVIISLFPVTIKMPRVCGRAVI